MTNPKLATLYLINKENYEISAEIDKELKIQEEMKQNIDECEDSLVEYHTMLKFNQEKHEKQINSMKELNESYLKSIENERKSLKNACENDILKTELNKLIDERNDLLLQINMIENEEQLSQENEENDLKKYIQYLKDQLKLINN